MRVFAFLVLLVVAAGCGRKQAPVKEYWDEEARLQMVQSAVAMLRESAAKKSGFVSQQDGDTAPTRSDFAAAVQLAIGSATMFTQTYSDSDNTPAIRELLKEVREIEAQKPTGPSPELTKKVTELLDKASKLKMRAMNKAEEASIQKSL